MAIFQVLQNKVARVCVDIHYSSSQMAAQYLQEMRRPYYIVPSTFIEYIDTFAKMHRSEGSKLHNIRYSYPEFRYSISCIMSVVTIPILEIMFAEESVILKYVFPFFPQRDRFCNGLAILSEATSLVTVMQEELVALGPQIEEKSKVKQLYVQIKYSPNANINVKIKYNRF